MNPLLNIRRAKPTENDLLGTIAMRSKAYWGYSAEFMASCLDELSYTPEQLTDHDFYVAVANSAIIGFYGLIQISDSTIELEALFLEPEQIGNGYGRQLYDHALQTAKKAARKTGATELIIQSDPNAKAFYLKVGAILVDEKESGSIPGRFLPLFSVGLLA